MKDNVYCARCEHLKSLQDAAQDLMIETATTSIPTLLTAARAFRLEISRNLALHERTCNIAQIKGKRVTPAVAEYFYSLDEDI